MMKIASGYVITAIFASLFVILAMNTSTEAKKVKGFHEVLDEKIVLDETNMSQTSYIKDRNGETISEIYRPMNRIFINSDQIPNFLRDLFIVSEDKHFYHHRGFDVPAIGRALAINMKAGEIEEGASTITQQLARNLYLSFEQSYNRKLSEILYAYQLERRYTKDEILDLYLNTIYFAQGAYGIEAAARTYFKKNTEELTKGELAFLAAIPNNPSLYDPIKNFDQTKKRQERLIDQLEQHGYINHEEATDIKNEPIELAFTGRTDKYPDYVTLVEEELKELIAEQDGFNKKLKEAETDEEKKKVRKQLKKRVDEVLGSGVIIETALDPDAQEKAKNAIKNRLPYSEVQGAAVIIDHENHEILAIVGGKDYKKHDFHRAFQAYRQPGSAIKPLLDYAPYIERTKASISQEISADEFCVGNYCPQNYGGGTYGMVTLQTAFSRSYNTPAVRLLHKTGIEESFSYLKKFKFKKLTKTDYVLPAAIGGFTYGMTPLELTNAYTTFANNGKYQPSRTIRQVTDLSGKVLYEWEDEPVEVWSEATVRKMRTLLNSVVTSGTGRRANFSSPYIGGKTGTTNNYNDFWFIGLTDKITTGVWVGKDDPSNIYSIYGSAPHLMIWRDIVTQIQ